jgi:preprotein translocase subunit SecF
MEFIKPNANFDFIGRRTTFFAVSSVVIIASLFSLFQFGFNKGIDFKGGTKIIVAFKPDAAVERSDLRQKLDDFIKGETKKDDAGQIEVQDFSAGSGSSATRKDFLLLTELTSLVSD